MAVLLDVTLLSAEDVLFEGKAKSVVMPGESGVLEILPFHKRLITRLLSGLVFVDDKHFRIRRGIAKINQNKVTLIIEQSL